MCGIMAQIPQSGNAQLYRGRRSNILISCPGDGGDMKQVLARIIDSAYRLAMDIGLGKFLEMFEERFGRKATTALLFMIGLGVLAVVIPPIYEHLIMPLYSFAGVFIGKIHSPEEITLTWTDVSQIGLTILQVMLTILQVFIIIAVCILGPIVWITMIHFGLSEFIFPYWEKYFLERSIKRKKAMLHLTTSASLGGEQ
jgi:hypothetical protein